MSSDDASLKKMYTDWISTKEAIVRYYNSSLDERAQQKVDLTSLESAANDLEKKLSSLSTDFKSHTDKENTSWDEVKQNVQEGEAAIEILRVKKRYVKDSIYYLGLVVKKSSAAPEMLIWPLGKRLEGRNFKYHRNTIKFKVVDTLSYRIYFQPIQKLVGDISTLYISCDGVFNKVNFNSLYNAKKNHFVIDDFTIRQLGSTREMVNHSSGQNSKPIAYLFGAADFNLGQPDQVVASGKRSGSSLGFQGEDIPFLPATEQEVDGISSVLTNAQWEIRPFKKMEASESNIKKTVNPRLMHVATHGFFLSDVDVTTADEEITNPLFRSGLLLAGAALDRTVSKQEEDGVLTAYEAMNLNLDQTDLVVLSACETGLGEVRNGEGVYGLQRAFMVAGARNVLMSLWQVDDKATQELMNTFYKFWAGGQDKHKAFREAQLKMKEQYAAPFYWGAFVIVGY
jgi:CHAT domain-containing protein